MGFKYDTGGIAISGTVTLYIDGQPAGEDWVEQTEPLGFFSDETCDIGNEFGSAMT